jgi:hypothetical protein
MLPVILGQNLGPYRATRRDIVSSLDVPTWVDMLQVASAFFNYFTFRNPTQCIHIPWQSH